MTIFKLFSLVQVVFPFVAFSISSTRYALINSILLTNMVFFGVYSLKDILYASPTMNFTWSELTYLKDNIDASLDFAVNPLGFFFSLLVVMIGLAANLYSIRYFSDEASEKKFIYILNCFIISMVILVCANNFYTIFVGWELIGITSFFLINFWSIRRGTLKSSFKAFSFNLVSDIFILTAFILFYSVSSCTNLDSFFAYVDSHALVDNSQLYYGLICLVLGSCLKSVQIFGHLWLPDSMEAPVPASALIHSATLVSAGIYLLCRFYPLITLFNLVNFLASVGAITAAYGGLVAGTQTDVKKLLAFSTMSHCGFMWFLAAIGPGYPILLYLYLHGIFKAMTFFCAGSLMRVFGTQDSRIMGEAHILARIDSFFLIFSAGNLAGLPFTLGFTYKYFFINMFFCNPINFYTIGFLFIALLSSLFYFFRLVFFVVFDYDKTLKDINNNNLKISEYIYINTHTGITYNYIYLLVFLFLCAYFMCYYFYFCKDIVFYFYPFRTRADADFFIYINFYRKWSYILLSLYQFYFLNMIVTFVFCWKKKLFVVEGICILVFFSLFTLFL